MDKTNYGFKDTAVTPGIFGFPRIEMPENIVETDDGNLAFEIDTHHGMVAVSSCGFRGWNCRGSASALAAAGLLRTEWLPGLPGNNKISQTVVFETAGPQLVYGNRRGKTMPGPCLVIKRASERSYVVEVPPTKDQDALIKEAHENYNLRRSERIKHDDRQKVEAGYKAIPEAELQQWCANFVGSCQDLILHRLDLCGFSTDAGMAEEMQGIFASLKRCVLAGKLQPKISRQGNVIPFLRPGAR